MEQPNPFGVLPASRRRTLIYRKPLTILMAKKGRRKRRFNLRRVRLIGTVAVGALASLDVGSGAITLAVADKLRLISINAAWGWSDVGASTDDDLEFGVAHSDYTAAEIEECLEATAAIDLGDKVAQERTNRLVRSIGILMNQSSTGAGSFADGRRVKTKLNWLLSEGDTLVVWFRNGSGAVYTTGSTITCQGDLWVKD